MKIRLASPEAHQSLRSLIHYASPVKSGSMAGVKRVVFIRHGLSLANELRHAIPVDKMDRTTFSNLPLGDVPLCDQGIQQAKRLRRDLFGEDSEAGSAGDESPAARTQKSGESGGDTDRNYQIWVSPLRRTIETAQTVFSRSGPRRRVFQQNFVPAGRSRWGSDIDGEKVRSNAVRDESKSLVPLLQEEGHG